MGDNQPNSKHNQSCFEIRTELYLLDNIRLISEISNMSFVI